MEIVTTLCSKADTKCSFLTEVHNTYSVREWNANYLEKVVYCLQTEFSDRNVELKGQVYIL